MFSYLEIYLETLLLDTHCNDWGFRAGAKGPSQDLMGSPPLVAHPSLQQCSRTGGTKYKDATLAGSKDTSMHSVVEQV